MNEYSKKTKQSVKQVVVRTERIAPRLISPTGLQRTCYIASSCNTPSWINGMEEVVRFNEMTKIYH